MIWPVAVITQVERCRVRHAVDPRLPAAVVEHELTKAASKLTKACEERFSVTIDPRDFESKVIGEDHDTPRRMYLTRWRPRWMNVDVEFVDGPIDGMLYAVPDIHGPILSLLHEPATTLSPNSPFEPNSAPPKHVRYELAGWNDRTRRWVFSPSVVPAPNKTGPWQTWQEVPDDTPFWSRDRRETNSWWWIKRTTKHRKELRRADSCGKTVHLGPTSFMNDFAPFVAAEEG